MALWRPQPSDWLGTKHSDTSRPDFEQVLNVNLTKQAVALWKKNIQRDFCSLATAKIEFYLICARLPFTSI
jgi:hypothetical protein